jgi:hypothetical protein
MNNQPAQKPAEQTKVHTHILRFGLGADEARAYWEQVGDRHPDQQAHPDQQDKRTALDAFSGQWFGQVSEGTAKIVMRNMRARFDAFPATLRLLAKWRPRDVQTRTMICHWHVQLTDPLYRTFTSEFLVKRRQKFAAEIERDHVERWVEEQQPERWGDSTRRMFASKLLSVAYAAGLVESNRDPRRLVYPRVTDDALMYALHLWREVETSGTLLDNPYLRSVGLTGTFLEDRIRTLKGVELRRMGDLTEFTSKHSSFDTWAEEVVR